MHHISLLKAAVKDQAMLFEKQPESMVFLPASIPKICSLFFQPDLIFIFLFCFKTLWKLKIAPYKFREKP